MLRTAVRRADHQQYWATLSRVFGDEVKMRVNEGKSKTNALAAEYLMSAKKPDIPNYEAFLPYCPPSMRKEILAHKAKGEALLPKMDEKPTVDLSGMDQVREEMAAFAAQARENAKEAVAAAEHLASNRTTLDTTFDEAWNSVDQKTRDKIDQEINDHEWFEGIDFKNV